eukprot:TRINITY_DN2207_c0_g2_i2.p2 TRINITY_DN2207_c0_g2~~TRINITY_DN2207_c0_g2_i2.p2  ORF type:complete len:181 (+),score=55.94 TRINITY_DN2207_c0_g2_i2:64-543(+)
MAAAPAEASYSTFESGQRSHHSSPRHSWQGQGQGLSQASPGSGGGGGGGEEMRKKGSAGDERGDRMSATPGTTRSSWGFLKDELLSSSRSGQQMAVQQQQQADDGGHFHSPLVLDGESVHAYRSTPTHSQGGGTGAGGGGGGSHPVSRRTSFNSFNANR